MDLICALQQPGSGHGAAEYLDLLNAVVVLERCDWLTGDIWNYLDLLNAVVVLERCDWLTGDAVIFGTTWTYSTASS